MSFSSSFNFFSLNDSTALLLRSLVGLNKLDFYFLIDFNTSGLSLSLTKLFKSKFVLDFINGASFTAEPGRSGARRFF